MSAPDPRGVYIAEFCEARPFSESWRNETDRRSQHAELVHPNDSIVAVAHGAPFSLTASMTIALLHMHRKSLLSLMDRRSA